MKKICIIGLGVLIFLSIGLSPAYAGRKQHYRWEGVAIGIGAAILGSAILNSCQNSPPPERVTVIEHNTYYHPAPPPGHYETRRVWIPPVCQRVWNPGHYECGRWVEGQYITIETSPGYWREERVWCDRR